MKRLVIETTLSGAKISRELQADLNRAKTTTIGKLLFSYHSTAMTNFANGVKSWYRVTNLTTQHITISAISIHQPETRRQRYKSFIYIQISSFPSPLIIFIHQIHGRQ